MRNNGRIFSDWMGSPTFTDAHGMMNEINKLEPSELVVPLHPEGDSVKNRFMIRNKITRDCYGFCTGKYKPVQDYEVAVPLYDAITDAGFNPLGRMYQRKDGKFYCDIKLEAPNFALEIGGSDRYDVGCRVYNGKNTMMGFGFKGMVIRYVCTNGMIFATGFGNFRATHLGTKIQTIKRFSRSIGELINDVAIFEKKANASIEKVVHPGEIKELLMGCGIAPETADEIISQLPILVPELIKDKISGYVIHNAVTAYASHEKRTEEGFEHLSKAAVRLLDVDDYENMVEAGKEKIKIRTK